MTERSSTTPDAKRSSVLAEPPLMARGGEAILHLRQALERVGRESESLSRVAASLEEFVRTQEGRYAELEQELNDTAQLYVASYQLQARTEPQEVLRHVRELLEQLIGVESFVLYLSPGDGRALPVAWSRLPESALSARRMNEAPLAALENHKTPLFHEQTPGARGTLQEPLAMVPLLSGERLIGAIVVVSLFPHKTSWAPVDHQLLHLLASHAGSALLAAHLLQRQGDLSAALGGLAESLK